jgi:hypothetical protein
MMAPTADEQQEAAAALSRGEHVRRTTVSGATLARPALPRVAASPAAVLAGLQPRRGPRREWDSDPTLGRA